MYKITHSKLQLREHFNIRISHHTIINMLHVTTPQLVLGYFSCVKGKIMQTSSCAGLSSLCCLTLCSHTLHTVTLH